MSSLKLNLCKEYFWSTSVRSGNVSVAFIIKKRIVLWAFYCFERRLSCGNILFRRCYISFPARIVKTWKVSVSKIFFCLIFIHTQLLCIFLHKNTSSARLKTRSALSRRNRVSKLPLSYSFIQLKNPKVRFEFLDPDYLWSNFIKNFFW